MTHATLRIPKAMSLAWVVLLTSWAACGLQAQEGAEEGVEFFEAKIRPLLILHCYECHSGVKTQGGLSLDSKAGWEQGGDSGAVVVPYRIDESLLIRAVQHDGLEMPPGKQLQAHEIEAVKEWVRLGAHDPRVAAPKLAGMRMEDAKSWWAFQPLPEVALCLDSSPIDRWIDTRLEQNQLAASPRADDRTLLRRATYDLTGLPPTQEQVDRYLHYKSDSAWARTVDELLSTQSYGVQWGRHWLDVVRYADTAGENTDRPLPHAWRYRNWVFDSFNRNMPYDQFVRMQIAGDLATVVDGGNHRQDEVLLLRQDGIVATGYLAIARRFGHDIDKDLHLTYEDVIDNLGKAFLGMTASCARCHDHKYDPVTSEDYYGLVGIFGSTQFAFPGCEAKGQPRDLVPLLSESQSEVLMRPWRERTSQIEAAIETRRAELDAKKKSFVAKASETTQGLLEANVEEGGHLDLDPSKYPMLDAVQVAKGCVLQLSILPNGNHGADTTMVDFRVHEIGGLERSWSTEDLIEDLLHSNPHPGSHGSFWCLIESTDGPTFLRDKRTTNGGSAAIPSWSLGNEPSIFTNQAAEPTMVWTKLAARSFFMHPGQGRPVALAWVSPIEGRVRITGSVADAHPAPGLDGVTVRIEQLGAPELGSDLLALGNASSVAIPGVEPPPAIPVAFAVREGTPSSVRQHLRGDPEKLGEEVPRRWLTIFGGDRVPPESGSGRRELADWIVKNPLFARVMVNRIWQWHFGQGLVRTPNDFGARGEAPTHPELLDWLAAQFVKSGYDVKAMHRMIMNSRAYQRNCQPTQVAIERDPHNEWLSHANRRRLTAEELRDTSLTVSGALDLSPGGPHPFPPENQWGFTQHDPFNAVYETNLRSAYLMVQRQRRHPFLALFDGADPNASTPTRQSTTVPTQSLYFLNDPFFHARASEVAMHMEPIAERDSKLKRVYSKLLQRTPTEREVEACQKFIERYPGTELDRWSAWIRVMMASNEFLFLD